MIDTTNAPDAPIPCPSCSRPIPLKDRRCRSCGTVLDEYPADAKELDFRDDEEIPEMRVVILGAWVMWGMLALIVFMIDAAFVIVVGGAALSRQRGDNILAAVIAPFGAGWLWISTRTLYREMQKVREIR